MLAHMMRAQKDAKNGVSGAPTITLSHVKQEAATVSGGVSPGHSTQKNGEGNRMDVLMAEGKGKPQKATSKSSVVSRKSLGLTRKSSQVDDLKSLVEEEEDLGPYFLNLPEKYYTRKYY